MCASHAQATHFDDVPVHAWQSRVSYTRARESLHTYLQGCHSSGQALALGRQQPAALLGSDADLLGQRADQQCAEACSRRYAITAASLPAEKRWDAARQAGSEQERCAAGKSPHYVRAHRVLGAPVVPCLRRRRRRPRCSLSRRRPLRVHDLHRLPQPLREGQHVFPGLVHACSPYAGHASPRAAPFCPCPNRLPSLQLHPCRGCTRVQAAA